MKLKQYVPYLFIFLMLFVNILPLNFVSSTYLNLLNGMNSSLNLTNTLTLITSLLGIPNYIQYFLYMVLLIVFIQYIKTFSFNELLNKLFIIGFILLLLINIVFSSITAMPGLLADSSSDTGSFALGFSHIFLLVILFLSVLIFIITAVLFIFIYAEKLIFSKLAIPVMASTLLLVIAVVLQYVVNPVLLIKYGITNTSYTNSGNFSNLLKWTIVVQFTAVLLFKFSVIVETLFNYHPFLNEKKTEEVKTGAEN